MNSNYGQTNGIKTNKEKSSRRVKCKTCDGCLRPSKCTLCKNCKNTSSKKACILKQCEQIHGRIYFNKAKLLKPALKECIYFCVKFCDKTNCK